MTWTYIPSQLPKRPLDVVRLMIGDTLSTDPQLQDEEISYLISTRSSLYGAAAECCRAIAAKFSRSVDQGSGANKVWFSQMAKAYNLRAIDFEQKATKSGAALPFSGGVDAQDGSGDPVDPAFRRGMFDNEIPIPSNNSTTGPVKP
jgi:hypothetical protein